MSVIVSTPLMVVVVIPLITVGEGEIYNTCYSVLTHVRDAIPLIIVGEGGGWPTIPVIVSPTCVGRYTPHYRRRGVNYNTCYSVPPHVGDALTLIIVGKGRNYNTFYSVPPHVGGRYNCHYCMRVWTYSTGHNVSPHVGDVIILIIVGERGTYNTCYSVSDMLETLL